jgi:hypothetical protein
MGNSHITNDNTNLKNENIKILNKEEIKQNLYDYYTKLNKKNALKNYSTKSNFNIKREDAVMYFDKLISLSKVSCTKKSKLIKKINNFSQEKSFIEILLKEVNEASFEIIDLLSLKINHTLPIFLENFEQTKRSNFCKYKKDTLDELEKLSESLTINNSFITENKAFSSILKDESYVDWLNKESYDEIASEIKEDLSQKTTSDSNFGNANATMSKLINKNMSRISHSEQPYLIKIDIRPFLSQNQKTDQKSTIDNNHTNSSLDLGKSIIPEIKNLKAHSHFSRK